MEKEGEDRENYVYNPLNQQIKSERSDGYSQENLYDGEGFRAGIMTKEGSTRFVFWNGELLTEFRQEEERSRRYILGYGVAGSEVGGEAGYHAYHLDVYHWR